jgi:hypothetical protein
MVHPFFLDLGICGIHAILFHHHQIEILDIGVVIGESTVDGRHLPHRLVEHERTFAWFVHEFVLVFEAINVADHLAYPRTGDLVLEFAAADLFLLAADLIGIPAEECYVFEDAYNGVRAGAASGAATIMIPDTQEPTDEMRSIAAGVYSSLTEAMEAIRKGEI